MKKSIIIAGIAAIIIAAGTIAILKATVGDARTELPGEERIEKTLNLQEKNQPSDESEDESTERGETDER